MKTRFQVASIFAALAISTAAFAAAVQSLSVKMVPKADAIHKYDMLGKVSVSGIDVTLKANMQEKIATVAADGGYSVEETMISGTVSTEQGEQDIPGSTETTTYTADGHVVKIEGGSDPTSSIRTAVLGTLIDPGKKLSVGDKWTVDIAEDKDKGIVAAKADYSIVGEEKVGGVDTIKVSAKITETSGSDPASSESTIWVDKVDGSRVKVESTWKNFPSQFGLMDATVTLTRTQ